MSNTNFITDHVVKALNRLLYQYKNKSKISGVLSAIVDQLQKLEDTLPDVVSKRGIDTATGINLDGAGQIAGIARVSGQSDDDYRTAIKNKIVQNLNTGTPEEVINAAKFFLVTDLVWYLEVYPAEVDIFTMVKLDPASRESIRALLESFLPAGVSLGSFGQYEGPDAFLFNLPKGFGDVNDSSKGGLLADVFPKGPDLPYYVLLLDALSRFLTDEDGNLLAG